MAKGLHREQRQIRNNQKWGGGGMEGDPVPVVVVPKNQDQRLKLVIPPEKPEIPPAASETGKA